MPAAALDAGPARAPGPLKRQSAAAKAGLAAVPEVRYAQPLVYSHGWGGDTYGREGLGRAIGGTVHVGLWG